MAATVSAWGKPSAWSKPGAWALDSEENESDLIQQRHDDAAAAAADPEPSDFPSLTAAAKTTTKKKKKGQTLSLHEFTTKASAAPPPPSRGLTPDEILSLPTGPRQRSADDPDNNELGGAFRSYGRDDNHPRRQHSHREPSTRDLAPSRADEIDNWATTKKSIDRRERGERGSFFTDPQSRADDVDNWASKKTFIPSSPARIGSFVSDSQSRADDVDNWASNKTFEPKKYEGRRGGGSFDSLKERRGDSESWGDKKREDASVVGVGTRPKLNLKPRTVPVGEEQRVEAVKTKGGSNPFGEAKPREEVLKEKGQDWKEIEEKLESTKIKEVASWGPPAVGKGRFWNGNGRENAWRKPESVGSRPESAGESETGSAVIHENGHHAEEAEEKDNQI